MLSGLRIEELFPFWEHSTLDKPQGTRLQKLLATCPGT